MTSNPATWASSSPAPTGPLPDLPQGTPSTVDRNLKRSSAKPVSSAAASPRNQSTTSLAESASAMTINSATPTQFTTQDNSSKSAPSHGNPELDPQSEEYDSDVIDRRHLPQRTSSYMSSEPSDGPNRLQQNQRATYRSDEAKTQSGGSASSWLPIPSPTNAERFEKSIHPHLPERPADSQWVGPTSHPYPAAALSPLQASLAYSLARLLSRPIFYDYISSPGGYATFHAFLSRRPDRAHALTALEMWKDLEAISMTLERTSCAAQAIKNVYLDSEAEKKIGTMSSTLVKETVRGLKGVIAGSSGLDQTSRHLLNSLFANEFQGFVKHRLLQHTRAQLARYELVAGENHGLGDAFCLTNPRLPDAPIVLASPAFCALTGYSAQQIIGRNCRFLQGEATSPESVQAIRRAVDKEEPITQLLLNYTASGVAFWNLLCILPLRNVDGELTYFIGGQTNLTGAISAGSGEDLSFVLSPQASESQGPTVAHGAYTRAVEDRIASTKPAAPENRYSKPESPASSPPLPKSIDSGIGMTTGRSPDLEPNFTERRFELQREGSIASRPKTPGFFSFRRKKKSNADVKSIKSLRDSHSPPLPSLSAPAMERNASSTSARSQTLMGAESLVDQTPAPIETKIADFQMTYERVILVRAETREILFVTSALLRYLGLPGASYSDVDSSPLVHLDVLTLIRGDEQKMIRNNVKKSFEHGTSLSIRCALSYSGNKQTLGISVKGTLHLSPLKDIKGDPVAFVGVFG